MRANRQGSQEEVPKNWTEAHRGLRSISSQYSKANQDRNRTAQKHRQEHSNSDNTSRQTQKVQRGRQIKNEESNSTFPGANPEHKRE
ncbi:hypothetical protein NPIL_528251 [Nephila pilipes]|uniref:Uncharacterized protein n=1 Tax=Nephila pilipes TaxID=299642 RepID=A0A8X6UVM9_NEPPI|nr:hypothetical protein NPIL_528251 [Nephila pilipes]